MDLFELIMTNVGCLYISDLKLEKYNHVAKILMCDIDFKRYSISELEDMAEYLYNKKIHFNTLIDAEEFFHREKNTVKVF